MFVFGMAGEFDIGNRRVGSEASLSNTVSNGLVVVVNCLS